MCPTPRHHDPSKSRDLRHIITLRPIHKIFQPHLADPSPMSYHDAQKGVAMRWFKKFRLRRLERKIQDVERKLAWIRDQRCPLSNEAAPDLHGQIFLLHTRREKIAH
jgi:hypothetical protein